ncbi:hypothetical protein [Paraliobacillus sp. JSM ZJ581]|uniref:hypothetical protein n=1 Tax=Paraliobacillus sp. JSM ZJ581 TaxID=3342118 RepID=UPI0035A94721
MLIFGFVFIPIHSNAEANSDMTLIEASKDLDSEDEELYNSMSYEEKNEIKISVF